MTSGRGLEPVSTSSPSPPAARTKSRTHSAARTTSSWCVASALTLGMRRSSENSSSQAGSSVAAATAANPSSGYVAELLRIRERAQLLQRLVLDLPDALTRDIERAADLVERARMLAVQPIPELEHLALARGELAEDLLERLLAQRDLGSLVGQRHRLVGDEVPELGLLLVADGLLE